MMITRLQVRMARAALGWGVRELAKQTGLAANTVSRFENGSGARAETLRLIQSALEKAGIVFIPMDDRDGPGVRLKGPKQREDNAESSEQSV
jgi:transcriptional regulator with XRE-family HTH domain